MRTIFWIPGNTTWRPGPSRPVNFPRVNRSATSHWLTCRTDRRSQTIAMSARGRPMQEGEGIGHADNVRTGRSAAMKALKASECAADRLGPAALPQ